ncbi:signal transduction histidine kinase [Paenibacillus endophyticus]|uniref:histidine kinase n=1 Tax=Paenibacillus endophyticus TaxID=1294268 RepID=A0A7W5C6A5_9BACL|nr:HAMP domain-containing sensor histidine kinase [Paenibacillus endophyticus]MBB3151881.1 signal transduction histidine kinase [Paenibacillus endophyticus]
MKLLYQINLAFAFLLILVLSLTAVMFHYVLLDHFIEVQKKDMIQMGQSISLNLQEVGEIKALPASSVVGGAIASVAKQSLVEVDAILTDASQNILYSSLEPVQVDIQSVPILQPSALAASSSTTGTQFITAASTIPQGGTLTLLTPISKIKLIEQSLLGRLLIVLCGGVIFAFLLSLMITRKLIKPLMKLQVELKKVKGRRFSEVKLIKADGEIGDVAKSVYELAGELNKYNVIQRQFIQNASHELKTPLMSISGYAEGIRDGIFEGEQVGKGLDIIMSESSRLKNIVTEMTLLAKLDGEEEHFKPDRVSLTEWIEETIERINPVLVKNHVTITTSILPRDRGKLAIYGDQDKLMQALLNVVSNAARHARSTILIQAGIGLDGIELSIIDDGEGISEELLPHLFHRFVKGKDGETGLGLAISRAIVERCGGMISAQNRPEGGAHIRLLFPVIVQAAA